MQTTNPEAGEGTPAGEATVADQREPHWGFRAFFAIADHFGVSGAVLAFVFVSVSFLGEPNTKDEFIRDVLWADTGRSVQAFFTVLIFDILFGRRIFALATKDESAELKRLVAENHRLQEELLQRTLSDGVDASAPSDSEDSR